ncbi:MAG: DoxX family protein [Euzebyales bacterium]|nr:DoxX family protein [Euzebyales bacterium]
MSLLRRLARPLLASMFVTGGVDALLNPAPKVPVADDVATSVAGHLPGLSEQDTETLVRLNGGVQVGAGTLFALGRFPRLSALALAASLVPTTAAAHRYWEYDDPVQRQQQQAHFFKNVSMLGGLLLASIDTEGRPSLGWRARHTVGHAEAAVRRSRREAQLAAKAARAKLTG